MLDKNYLSEIRIAANQNSKDKSYWLDKFLGFTTKSFFPYDKSFSNKRSLDVINFNIDEITAKKLINLSNSSDFTLHIFLMTGCIALMNKYNRSHDIIIGTSIYKQEVEKKLINTVLGIRNEVKDNITFKELLIEIRKNMIEAIEHQSYPIEILVEELDMKIEENEFPLFDVNVILENIQSKKYIDNINSNMKFTFIRNDQFINGRLEYNSELYSNSTALRIVNHFKRFMKEALADVNKQLDDIEILSDEEIRELIYKFNDNKVEFSDKHICEIIEQNAKKNPSNIAIICGDKKITYWDLHQKSNNLAMYLSKEKSLRKEQCIGLIMERSIDFIVSIIGIWKSGSVYVPIDGDFPIERVKNIIDDAEIEIVISEKKYLKNLNILQGECKSFNKYLCVDSYNINGEDEKQTSILMNESSKNKHQHDLSTLSKYCSDEIFDTSQYSNINDLAYVIYTSGSTGKPKGAMVEHIGMMNHIYAKINDLNLTNKDIICQNASQSFDISIWQMFVTLTCGGTTIIYTNDVILNPEKFIEKIIEDKITILEVVPSYLLALQDLLSIKHLYLQYLRYLVVTGETVKKNIVEKWFELYPEIKMVNAYGPTEASDDITHYIMDSVPNNEFVSIGRPVQNFNIYIVDEKMNLCPIGVKGEICVSGIGVGRGYLNNINKTSEVFMSDPFIKEKEVRLYKTGDIGRWLLNGNIEFYGRKDYQVKIRGYRIELGEIESKLITCRGVKEAFVIDGQDDNKSKYMCAFLIKDNGIAMNEIKEYLKELLPSYMIPSYFIELEQMPLTLNGKVDRKKLLQISDVHIKKLVQGNNGHEIHDKNYNENTKLLMKIFSEVLGNRAIGIDENFFEVGGDSIKAMQISARLQKYKLNLGIKDIFNNPTIRELQKHVKLIRRQIDQGIVEGEVELTPIQKWVFENQFEFINYYNQATMLYKNDGFNEETLNKAMTKIIEHHDALRMKYEFNNNVIQINRGIDEGVYELKIITIEKDENIERMIQNEANKIQSSLNLNNGPLVKLGVFKTNKGDYLLIVVHHLVVDGVSWRIILEDFSTCYKQIENHEEVILPEKSDSFKVWANSLNEYAKNGIDENEVDYWRKVNDIKVNKIYKEYEIDINKKIMKNVDMISLKLNKSETNNLLKRDNIHDNIEINDILLTTLGESIKTCFNIDKIAVNLEGHGREDIIEDLYINRTVGWFTSLFPIVLDLSKSQKLEESIQCTSQMLSKIPNKGIGYGIIKYLRDRDEESNSTGISPEISFNYLGEFINNDENTMFNICDMKLGETVSRFPMGEIMDGNTKREVALNVEGYVIDGELILTFGFNKYEYKRETIRNLADCYKDKLINIIECLRQKQYYQTSSAQKRMYALQQLDLNSDAYNIPAVIDIEGKLDVTKVEDVLNQLIERHETLRTSFEIIDDEIVQKINKNIKINVVYKKKGEESIDDVIKAFIKPFNLAKAPLLRIMLIEVEKDRHLLMFDMHHIISDGVSMGIFIDEFSELYKGNKLPDIKMQYKEFAAWQNERIRNGEIEKQKKYWLNRFSGEIPVLNMPYDYKRPKLRSFVGDKKDFEINDEINQGIKNVAISTEVSSSMVLLAALNILISKYTGQDDIIIGTPISGRTNADLEGLIGMFVNTLAIRSFPRKDKSILELLYEIKRDCLDAYDNQEYQFEELVSNLNITRDVSRNPIFDIMYSIQNIDNYKICIDNTKFINYDFENKTSKFDFILDVEESNEKFRFSITYSTELFKKESIDIVSKHYVQILEQIIRDINTKIEDIILENDLFYVETTEDEDEHDFVF